MKTPQRLIPEEARPTKTEISGTLGAASVRLFVHEQRTSCSNTLTADIFSDAMVIQGGASKRKYPPPPALSAEYNRVC
jgi:hypothetical protein